MKESSSKPENYMLILVSIWQFFAYVILTLCYLYYSNPKIKYIFNIKNHKQLSKLFFPS